MSPVGGGRVRPTAGGRSRTRASVREITARCSTRTERSVAHASHPVRAGGDSVGTRCDSGGVTTLHPVRSAPPPGTDPAPVARGALRRGGPAGGGARRHAPTTSSPSPTSTTCPSGRAGRRPWPGWVSPPLRARLRGARRRRAVAAPGGGGRAGPHDGAARRRRHRHGVGQVAGLPAAGAHPAGRGPARLRALPGADQGAGPRPARRGRCARRPARCARRAYDGDTPAEERDWVRAHSRWIVTNPDMLHRGILPAHQRWSTHAAPAAPTSSIDECHAYRGRVRLARRPRAAPAAPDLPPLRRRAGVRAGLGHRGRPAQRGRAGWSAPRSRR